jgi:uncharacterized protein DUF3592
VFALYIILFWLAVGGIVLVVFYWRKEMKMTSSTTGEVVSAENREIRDDAGRRDETLVLAKYNVSGNEYQIKHVFRGRLAERFPAGRQIPVKYNPSDPKMARIPVE